MPTPLSSSALKVQAALRDLGMELEVLELPASTRTAVEAAQAAGCQLGQIVKTLVFRGQTTGQAVLILASGSNRVDEAKASALVGETLGKADADFVRQQTGFAIGGVPPVGHNQQLETLIDKDLLQYTEIWAAAGTPNAVFRLTPQDLIRMSGGKVVQIAPDRKV